MDAKTGASASGLAASLGLAAHGFNVVGVLSRERYDALVPPAWRAPALLPATHTALVLATGGPDFWRAFEASPEARRRGDPIDAFAERVVAEAVAGLSARGARAVALHYWQRRGGVFADFPGLARAAGLGTPSRLALLLHPRFGPWLAIRAVLLCDRQLAATAPPPDFDPCARCPAPCLDACPGDAPAPGGFRLDRCVETTRATPACRVGCAARRACPAGAGERYPPAAEAAHRAAALAPIRIA